jgi:UPF0148 protein
VVKIKESSKIMADLLRKGYTMLNLSCPVCNNPVFRDKNGDKFCPICNRKVLIVDNYDNKKNSLFEPSNSTIPEKKDSENDLNRDIPNLLKKIVINKINLIVLKLKAEDQVENIERYTNILLNLIKLYKKVEIVKNH